MTDVSANEIERDRDGGREEPDDVRHETAGMPSAGSPRGTSPTTGTVPVRSRHRDDDARDDDGDEWTRDRPREPSDEQDGDEAAETERERRRNDLPVDDPLDQALDARRSRRCVGTVKPSSLGSWPARMMRAIPFM